MPEGPDGKTIIIVKKVSGHGGHHGGAWKVAYADFVTAMMALFLVLWLVNSASVATREALASYFRRPGVFEAGSGSPLEIGGGGILPDTFAPPADADSQTLPHHNIYEEAGAAEEAGDTGALTEEEEKERSKFDELLKELQEEVERMQEEYGALLGQFELKVDQQGLHLEIMDTENASMFSVGSSILSSEAQQALRSIATILMDLPNPIDIEGHTDATPFSAKMQARYDNWNLSTDRANAARRIFQEQGMKDEKIARVVGFSAQRLKREDDSHHPSNRRISISMRFTDRAAKALSQKKAVTSQLSSSSSSAASSIHSELRSENSSKGSQFKWVERMDPKEEADEAARAQEIERLANESEKQSKSSGLKFELRPSTPSEMGYEGSSDASKSGGKKLDDDLIFGDDNPFFGTGAKK